MSEHPANQLNISPSNTLTEMDIHESMAALISFLDYLKVNIYIFRREFTQAYESFTQKVTAPSTDLNSKKITINDGKYSIVTDLYKFFMNLLTNFMTSFTKEYTETLSMAINLSNLKESYNDIFKRYTNFDDLDTEHLYQLEKKVRRIIDRHNKLALKYNARIRHFETLRRNILNGTLVYTSGTKRFAVSVSDKLIRFKQIIASDAEIRRKPLNIGSVPQFPQAMGDTASKFRFVEISPLGESNLRYQPRKPRLSAKRKSDESEKNKDSDESSPENQKKQPEERKIIKRGARRTKGFEKIKPLIDRVETVKNLLQKKIIVDDECKSRCTEILNTLSVVLPYDIEKLISYIQILKDDGGITKAERIVGDILQTPNLKCPPIKIYGMPSTENDLDSDNYLQSKKTKLVQRDILIKKYDRLKAENDVKTIILKDGRAEIEAFGKSADLLCLLDNSFNYTLTDCNEFMIVQICDSLLKMFVEAKNELPGIIRKIHINDNPPLGQLSDYHNLSTDAKNLLIKQKQLERQMRNAFSLYDKAINKSNLHSPITSNEEIKVIMERIKSFVEACIENIDGKIEDLKQELKVLDDEIKVMGRKKKISAVGKKTTTKKKDSPVSGDGVAATSADGAAATSVDDDVTMSDDGAPATSGDGASATSVHHTMPFIAPKNPTRPPKTYISARLNSDLSPDNTSFSPELLTEVVEELKIKIVNPTRDQMKMRNPKTKNPYHKSEGECRNILLTYQLYDNKFGKFLEDWASKITIDTMNIHNYEKISKLMIQLEGIEKTGKLVAKTSLQPLTSVLNKSLDDDEEMVKLQIEYLSLSLIFVYLQVQYYDYQREQVIQSTDKNSEVDRITAEIKHANKCFELIVIKLEKLIPE